AASCWDLWRVCLWGKGSVMTPRIVVNGRFLRRHITGVERYGGEILRFIGNSSRVEATRSQGWAGHAWEQFVLPAKLNGHSVLWSPANTGPLLIRDQALTIHDLSPLEHPEWFQTNFAVWYQLFLPILAKRVRKVFTPSEHVKQKIIKRFGIQDVTVTPNGVDPLVFHPGAKQTRLDLPARYVLFVGTLEPRKNLNFLLQVWNEIKDDFRETWLIIVGVNGNVFRHVEYRHQMERVCFPGYVDDQTLAGLYANATLFVLPSQDEGFGLPALEAMASGTPVVVSDGGALPEVVRDAGMIFCLSNPDKLTKVLKECLSNARLRSALKEKGLRRAGEFSWQATAESVWKSLNEI
ncbi:MAG TPA: glycosyltransferase family 1 protein, partial [Anaerolineales bacterium]|nr:glycosyltransferase family 1 protein [Anaerolineales bacterium]